MIRVSDPLNERCFRLLQVVTKCFQDRSNYKRETYNQIFSVGRRHKESLLSTKFAIWQFQHSSGRQQFGSDRSRRNITANTPDQIREAWLTIVERQINRVPSVVQKIAIGMPKLKCSSWPANLKRTNGFRIGFCERLVAGYFFSR